MTTRIVSRRDSATTILRKMGINARDYDVFIKQHTTDDGQQTFEVNVALAESHLKGLQQQAAATPAKKVIKVSEKKEPVPVSNEVQKSRNEVHKVSKKTIASPFPIETLTKGHVRVNDRTGSASMILPKTKGRNAGHVNIPYEGESMSAFCRKLILAGHSNDEIWLAMQKQFDVNYETHRGYPAWFRHKLRKDGHVV